ncbi:MAG: hypothetical protein A3I04_07435 [Nitrospinae bacterium RIFCSPLOWO2_02_FULL_39_110]|nr:MAG: hypothetical protein A3D97_04745 [Nitrospinae bacterium RIFCSPHIGHO2_12_FULL_39_42]OGV99975.1 MAG: hypothetical protein A3D20_05665 [Nitrospinae bacterium RIFCSPHIGHO2_02_FULL_39_82]OGW05933.1 MAG: hypothetical protein A2Z59_06930 [Nitrospinae bacterium RIFCSPLOWO2_02_39_17]OGW06207.1 MAG: hypothetical protein A3I04_07435 [Nitrospinae bacterium RIFCSPLOWO2_02_FULL_39_110]OGW11710.1 MAG: hypothetical protein A3F81_01955 [Nitrospinae bacterium RIFCSPLOWO2_12_FULL_39_93]
METPAPLHGLPPRPVQVEGSRLPKEQEHIHIVGGQKNTREVTHQLGIADEENKKKKGPYHSGHFKRGREQFRKFLGQLIVPGILCLHRDQFADPDKDRDTQDESAKEEVNLGNYPDEITASDPRNIPVVYRGGLPSLLGKGRVEAKQSYTKEKNKDRKEVTIQFPDCRSLSFKY